MINLDAMSITDLEKTADNLEKLTKYAHAKRIAMKWRLDGNIQRALMWESKCEKLYSELDPEFRW